MDLHSIISFQISTEYTNKRFMLVRYLMFALWLAFTLSLAFNTEKEFNIYEITFTSITIALISIFAYLFIKKRTKLSHLHFCYEGIYYGLPGHLRFLPIDHRNGEMLDITQDKKLWTFTNDQTKEQLQFFISAFPLILRGLEEVKVPYSNI